MIVVLVTIDGHARQADVYPTFSGSVNLPPSITIELPVHGSWFQRAMMTPLKATFVYDSDGPPPTYRQTGPAHQ